jgi:hypothetical protein
MTPASILRRFCEWWMREPREADAPPVWPALAAFAKKPSVAVIVHHGASALALVLAITTASSVMRRLRRPPPAPLPADSASGSRFGLDEATRRQIFREVADADPAARARAADRFQDLWSREDDRASAERETVHKVAHQRGISLTQVYLVVDEGIRSHWPASNGATLEARTVPLKPRGR